MRHSAAVRRRPPKLKHEVGDMAIEVRVTPVLQNLVGAKVVEARGATVGELLENLDVRYPGFRAEISGEDGQLHRFVNIYVNDEDIRYLQVLDTPLKDGDVVSILPALAGGAGLGREGSG